MSSLEFCLYAKCGINFHARTIKIWNSLHMLNLLLHYQHMFQNSVCIAMTLVVSRTYTCEAVLHFPNDYSTVQYTGTNIWSITIQSMVNSDYSNSLNFKCSNKQSIFGNKSLELLASRWITKALKSFLRRNFYPLGSIHSDQYL